jgi:hypothetical protein
LNSAAAALAACALSSSSSLSTSYPSSSTRGGFRLMISRKKPACSTLLQEISIYFKCNAGDCGCDAPFCRPEDHLAAPIDPHEHIVPSSVIYSLDSSVYRLNYPNLNLRRTKH